jgi:hypothetical protein
MTELQNSLHHMGAAQYLLAVAFVICYALVLGDFFGASARWGLAAAGGVSVVGFSVLAQYWVHGVLLTLFVLVGMGLFIGLTWLLKVLVVAWQKRGQGPAQRSSVLQMGEFGDTYSKNNDEHAAVEHARG